MGERYGRTLWENAMGERYWRTLCENAMGERYGRTRGRGWIRFEILAQPRNPDEDVEDDMFHCASSS